MAIGISMMGGDSGAPDNYFTSALTSFCHYNHTDIICKVTDFRNIADFSKDLFADLHCHGIVSLRSILDCPKSNSLLCRELQQSHCFVNWEIGSSKVHFVRVQRTLGVHTILGTVHNIIVAALVGATTINLMKSIVFDNARICIGTAIGGTTGTGI